jgi:hypothetical protein
MEETMIDRANCIATLPGEACLNCGWTYGDIDPHPVLPATYCCEKCRAPYTLEHLECGYCAFIPSREQKLGLTRTYDARLPLLKLKQELRRARHLPPLDEAAELGDGPSRGSGGSGPSGAPMTTIGRLVADPTTDRCVRCQRPWNLDALRCPCGYLPDAAAELAKLIARKNEKRAMYNQPPLPPPAVTQQAPLPGKVVMQPTAHDVEASRERRSTSERGPLGNVAKWP